MRLTKQIICNQCLIVLVLVTQQNLSVNSSEKQNNLSYTILPHGNLLPFLTPETFKENCSFIYQKKYDENMNKNLMEILETAEQVSRNMF